MEGLTTTEVVVVDSLRKTSTEVAEKVKRSPPTSLPSGRGLAVVEEKAVVAKVSAEAAGIVERLFNVWMSSALSMETESSLGSS